MSHYSLTNWAQHQHYKDRDPPWVKLYRDTLSSESWVLGTDTSRLLQVASIMLAARYNNKIPLNFAMLKKVASFDFGQKAFNEAIQHLVASNFVAIQEDEPSASTVLAPCATKNRGLYSEAEAEAEAEAEQSRGREERSVAPIGAQAAAPPVVDDPVARVFDHWRSTHGHPQAQLDPKRRKLIRDALKLYPEASLCQAITGYLNSPYHMGQNDRSTRYDGVDLLLRDAKHIDAGLKFYAEPPRTDLSSLTRKNVAAIEDWRPPEVRNAS